MKYIIIFLLVVFGVIYHPLLTGYLKFQKWYVKQKKEDEVLWWTFAPFFWISFVIVSTFSFLYEELAKYAK